jgi:hypothetical protein
MKRESLGWVVAGFVLIASGTAGFAQLGPQDKPAADAKPDYLVNLQESRWPIGRGLSAAETLAVVVVVRSDANLQ